VKAVPVLLQVADAGGNAATIAVTCSAFNATAPEPSEPASAMAASAGPDSFASQPVSLCVPIVPEDEDGDEDRSLSGVGTAASSANSSHPATAAPSLISLTSLPPPVPTFSLAGASSSLPTLTLTSAVSSHSQQPPPPPHVSTVTLFMSQSSVTSIASSSSAAAPGSADQQLGASVSKIEPGLVSSATGLTARPLPPLFRQTDVVVGPPCLCLPASLAHSNFASRAVELLNKLHASAIANGEVPIDSCSAGSGGVTLFVLGNSGGGNNGGGSGNAGGEDFTPSPASSFPSPARQPAGTDDMDEVIADVVPRAVCTDGNADARVQQSGIVEQDCADIVDDNAEDADYDDTDDAAIVEEKPAVTSSPIVGFTIRYVSPDSELAKAAQSTSSSKAAPAPAGGRLYSCPVCCKCFSNHSNLMRHKRVHSGARPFQCVVCAKAFSQSNNLYQHQIIHTGRRPYICRLCRSAFTLPGNLQKHVQRSHIGSVQSWQEAMELEEDLPQLLTAIRTGSFTLQRQEERTDEPSESLGASSDA
ncbi:hypothetical protein BOX15_Mlig032758g1, partial [Macrostomum lignano]